ncbi:MAG: cation diffusion facilitator family transporter [Alphaproteobacteria bacterium]|nr:cation diffusion facilitator family transporter [Alphaproteobacteria bacterium]
MPPDHHGHDHHHHHHTPADFGGAFLAGIALNTAFIVAEVAFGLRANSLALLADAGHNAGDVFGLVLSLAAAVLGKRRPSARFTYGFGGFSIIAATVNAVVLLVAVGAIGFESLLRLARPEQTGGTTMMAVAAFGVLVNGATALLFIKGRKHDLNVRSAYLHMVADAAISLGVVVAGGVVFYTHWARLDPLASLVISGLIVVSTFRILKESLSLSLQAVPPSIDPAQVKARLGARPGVLEVHDLHLWALNTAAAAASVHLVMAGGHPGDAFIKDIAQELEHDFNISHTTVQIELGDGGTSCPFAPDHVV